MSTSDRPPDKRPSTVAERLDRARARIRPYISKEEGQKILEEFLEERREAARRE